MEVFLLTGGTAFVAHMFAWFVIMHPARVKIFHMAFILFDTVYSVA